MWANILDFSLVFLNLPIKTRKWAICTISHVTLQIILVLCFVPSMGLWFLCCICWKFYILKMLAALCSRSLMNDTFCVWSIWAAIEMHNRESQSVLYSVLIRSSARSWSVSVTSKRMRTASTHYPLLRMAPISHHFVGQDLWNSSRSC